MSGISRQNLEVLQLLFENDNHEKVKEHFITISLNYELQDPAFCLIFAPIVACFFYNNEIALDLVREALNNEVTNEEVNDLIEDILLPLLDEYNKERFSVVSGGTKNRQMQSYKHDSNEKFRHIPFVQPKKGIFKTVKIRMGMGINFLSFIGLIAYIVILAQEVTKTQKYIRESKIIEIVSDVRTNYQKYADDIFQYTSCLKGTNPSKQRLRPYVSFFTDRLAPDFTKLMEMSMCVFQEDKYSNLKFFKLLHDNPNAEIIKQLLFENSPDYEFLKANRDREVEDIDEPIDESPSLVGTLKSTFNSLFSAGETVVGAAVMVLNSRGVTNEINRDMNKIKQQISNAARQLEIDKNYILESYLNQYDIVYKINACFIVFLLSLGSWCSMAKSKYFKDYIYESYKRAAPAQAELYKKFAMRGDMELERREQEELDRMSYKKDAYDSEDEATYARMKRIREEELNKEHGLVSTRTRQSARIKDVEQRKLIKDA